MSVAKEVAVADDSGLGIVLWMEEALDESGGRLASGYLHD